MEHFLGYFNLATAFFLIVSMVMMLGRLLGGPTLYDRLLAVNSFGTKTILFLCVFCFVINFYPNNYYLVYYFLIIHYIFCVLFFFFFCQCKSNILKIVCRFFFFLF